MGQDKYPQLERRRRGERRRRKRKRVGIKKKKESSAQFEKSTTTHRKKKIDSGCSAIKFQTNNVTPKTLYVMKRHKDEGPNVSP